MILFDEEGFRLWDLDICDVPTGAVLKEGGR